jgi:hypothetical protein
VTRALCLLTVAGFCVATWGLFARHGWWEVVALGSATLGLLALPACAAAAGRGGEPAGTVSWNVFVHRTNGSRTTDSGTSPQREELKAS